MLRDRLLAANHSEQASSVFSAFYFKGIGFSLTINTFAPFANKRIFASFCNFTNVNHINEEKHGVLKLILEVLHMSNFLMMYHYHLHEHTDFYL